MAAPTIEAVMDALEARLSTVPGLRTSTHSPGKINPPEAIVGAPDIDEYRLTFGRGRMTLLFQVTVLTSAAFDRPGQRKLAAFASVTGDQSIPLAIEADQTLGGMAETCYVASYRALGLEEVGAIGYFGGIFSVPVTVKGK
ncbi:hypothetical protein L3Q67_00980 [Saccharothrix sp. AJ9571]|nr:hypothetical protein L3Q67_00980 [Saccharothrix sp. AJ9571]